MNPAVDTLKRCALLLLVAQLLIGCASSSPKVSYYALTPMAEAGREAAVTGPWDDFLMGIGPVRFPKLIDRPQIVTRPTPGRLELSDFQRWGGYFKEDFKAVLSTNIATLLGSDQVVEHPWPGMLTPAVQIEIDVHRFDGRLGDTVVLEASWILKRAGRKGAVQLRRVVIEAALSGRDYDALVAAKSKAVVKLSEMIVAELKAQE